LVAYPHHESISHSRRDWIAQLLARAAAQAEQSPYGQLNTKAVQLYSEGKYDEAVTTGEEALKLAEETLAPDDKDLMVVLENLAASYTGAKKTDQAKATYERLLAMKEKDVSTDPTSKARTLFNLGSIAIVQTNWTAAEDYFKRCLEIREKFTRTRPRRHHHDPQQIRVGLPKPKEVHEELPLLERERVAWEKSKGRTHPNSAQPNTTSGYQREIETQGRHRALLQGIPCDPPKTPRR